MPIYHSQCESSGDFTAAKTNDISITYNVISRSYVTWQWNQYFLISLKFEHMTGFTSFTRGTSYIPPPHHRHHHMRASVVNDLMTIAEHIGCPLYNFPLLPHFLPFVSINVCHTWPYNRQTSLLWTTICITMLPETMIWASNQSLFHPLVNSIYKPHKNWIVGNNQECSAYSENKDESKCEIDIMYINQ